MAKERYRSLSYWDRIWTYEWKKVRSEFVVWWRTLVNTAGIIQSVYWLSDICWRSYIKKVKTFLIIKPTRCTNFPNLFLEWNSTCFGQFLCPSSGIFHCTHSNCIRYTGFLTACEQEHMLLLTSFQQTCMTYTTAVCTVKNSWWWTQDLSKTCGVSFQE